MPAFLLRSAAFLVFSLMSLSASAQVYKCVDPAGKLTYQSKPCPEKSKGIELAIRDSAAVPMLDGNVTPAVFKQEMVKQCLATRGGPASSDLARLAKEQPLKFQSFCQCAADTALSDMDVVSKLMAKRDQEGMRQLGVKAGISCAAKLK